MAKGGREKIKLESTAGTGHFYTTTKNKRTTPEKMEIMKFDPKARKHVSYKETKIKQNFLAEEKTALMCGFFMRTFSTFEKKLVATCYYSAQL